MRPKSVFRTAFYNKQTAWFLKLERREGIIHFLGLFSPPRKVLCCGRSSEVSKEVWLSGLSGSTGAVRFLTI